MDSLKSILGHSGASDDKLKMSIRYTKNNFEKVEEIYQKGVYKPEMLWYNLIKVKETK